MADINARLKRALDGPAPQHKIAGEESFEVTEGSGGQLHVKDADVSAELAEIERTQADILARLDGTINTQVTGSNVEQGVTYRSPETVVVFNETVEGDGRYKVLMSWTDIPENVQSIAVSMRKNSQTNISTEYSYRQDSDIIYSKQNNWKYTFQAIVPTIGDSLRIRIIEMAETSQPLFIAVTYFFAPQEQSNTEDNTRLDNLESAITSLGGSV